MRAQGNTGLPWQGPGGQRAYNAGNGGYRQTDAFYALVGGIFKQDNSQLTFTKGNGDKIWFIDTTSGNITVNLPAADEGVSFIYTVKRTTGGANTLTVQAASGNIDGAATHLIPAQYAAFSYMSDGVNYWII